MPGQSFTRKDLWRGRRLLQLDAAAKAWLGFLVVVSGFCGGVCGLLLGRQLGDTVAVGLSAAGALAGSAFGIAVFADFLLAALAERRSNRILRRFQGLRSARAVLRPTVSDDAEAVVLTMDPVVQQANGLEPSNPGDRRLALHHDGFRELLDMITIVDGEDGHILGFASFNGLHDDGVPEVGFWLGPEARGQGLGAEIVGALGQVARDEGFTHIWFGTAEQNLAMRKSCARAGAAHMHDRPHRLPNGQTVASSWYLLATRPDDDSRPPFNPG